MYSPCLNSHSHLPCSLLFPLVMLCSSSRFILTKAWGSPKMSTCSLISCQMTHRLRGYDAKHSTPRMRCRSTIFCPCSYSEDVHISSRINSTTLKLDTLWSVRRILLFVAFLGYLFSVSSSRAKGVTLGTRHLNFKTFRLRQVVMIVPTWSRNPALILVQEYPFLL